jgi:hypothetical protein
MDAFPKFPSLELSPPSHRSGRAGLKELQQAQSMISGPSENQEIAPRGNESLPSLGQCPEIARAYLTALAELCRRGEASFDHCKEFVEALERQPSRGGGEEGGEREGGEEREGGGGGSGGGGGFFGSPPSGDKGVYEALLIALGGYAASCPVGVLPRGYAASEGFGVLLRMQQASLKVKSAETKP